MNAIKMHICLWNGMESHLVVQIIHFIQMLGVWVVSTRGFVVKEHAHTRTGHAGESTCCPAQGSSASTVSSRALRGTSAVWLVWLGGKWRTSSRFFSLPYPDTKHSTVHWCWTMSVWGWLRTCSFCFVLSDAAQIGLLRFHAATVSNVLLWTSLSLSLVCFHWG